MISLHQYLFLQFGALNLIVINNDIFPQRLHGVNFLRSLLFDKEYLTKASSPNDFPDKEILETDLFVTSPCIQGLRCFSESTVSF
jgi:hypothetical protein